MRRALTFLTIALMLTTVPRLGFTPSPVKDMWPLKADGTQAVRTIDGKVYQHCISPYWGLKALCWIEE